MPEVKILIKHSVDCPQFVVPVLLTMCRFCPHYRYETVNCKVMCDFMPKARDPREPRPKGDKESPPRKKIKCPKCGSENTKKHDDRWYYCNNCNHYFTHRND